MEIRYPSGMGIRPLWWKFEGMLLGKWTSPSSQLYPIMYSYKTWTQKRSYFSSFCNCLYLLKRVQRLVSKEFLINYLSGKPRAWNSTKLVEWHIPQVSLSAGNKQQPYHKHPHLIRIELCQREFKKIKISNEGIKLICHFKLNSYWKYKSNCRLVDLSTASGSFYDTSASVDLQHFAMFPVWQTVKEFPLRALEKDLFFLSQSAVSSVIDSYPYLVKLFTNWQRKLYWIDNRSTMFYCTFRIMTLNFSSRASFFNHGIDG